MAEKSLKDKTISGVLWSAIQKFGTLGISFVSNIVLARLLSPDDYGCIGMLAIFIAVSMTFIDGGFGSALIQKKVPTQEDYSTIFWWNLFVSIVLYVLFYLASPWIADFYKIEKLNDLLRIQGIVLIINSFNVIQVNQLRKKLKFKLLAIVNVVSSVVSVIIAIIMAWKGMGVWALVANQLLHSSFNTILLWLTTGWYPSLCFSFKSFKSLFGFGGFMLLSNIINTICDNIHGILIGKILSPSILGYYTQSRKLEEIATSSISGVVNQVAYPVFSDKQREKKSLITILSKFITFISFCVFPLMILLILVAEPLITVLYSDKWIECVPFFKILCIAGLAISLQMINYNAVAAVGQSAVLFKWTIIKRSIGLTLNILGIVLFGIYGLLFANVLTAYILYIINSYLVSQYVGYKIKDQLKDIMPTLVISVVSYFLTSICQTQLSNFDIYLILIFTILIFFVIYFILSRFFNRNIFNIFFSVTYDLMHK